MESQMHSPQGVAEGADDNPGRLHVQAKRAAARHDAEDMGVDAAFIDRLVETFYGHIRSDEMLGPIFAERIADWPPHLARMKAFWRSLLHLSGEFNGNPMAKHIAIPGLEEAHFARWLDLFYQTLRELAQDPRAPAAIGARARMIADSLLTGIALRRDGLAGARAGKDLPHV